MLSSVDSATSEETVFKIPSIIIGLVTHSSRLLEWVQCIAKTLKSLSRHRHATRLHIGDIATSSVLLLQNQNCVNTPNVPRTSAFA